MYQTTVYSVVMESIHNNIDMTPDFNTLLHADTHTHEHVHRHKYIHTRHRWKETKIVMAVVLEVGSICDRPPFITLFFLFISPLLDRAESHCKRASATFNENKLFMKTNKNATKVGRSSIKKQIKGFGFGKFQLNPAGKRRSLLRVESAAMNVLPAER